MARTRAETAAALGPLCQSDVYPLLTSDDLLRIVDGCLRASTHAVLTAYAVGDAVIPSSPNGRRYRCVVAGTSSSTAPTWPTATASQFLRARIGDGTTLVWEDDGPAHQQVYDLKKAARDAWLEKAAKASADVAISDGGNRVALEQIHAHCLAMAERHRPLEIW